MLNNYKVKRQLSNLFPFFLLFRCYLWTFIFDSLIDWYAPLNDSPDHRNNCVRPKLVVHLSWMKMWLPKLNATGLRPISTGNLTCLRSIFRSSMNRSRWFQCGVWHIQRISFSNCWRAHYIGRWVPTPENMPWVRHRIFVPRPSAEQTSQNQLQSTLFIALQSMPVERIGGFNTFCGLSFSFCLISVWLMHYLSWTRISCELSEASEVLMSTLRTQPSTSCRTFSNRKRNRLF